MTRACPKRRLWRFNAHRVQKKDCEKVVRDGWESTIEPDCFDILFFEIDLCQLGLRNGRAAFIIIHGST